MNFAPIVLFVYNRPEHTKKTIEYLKNNYLAKDSDLFVFSDAPKKDEDIKSVDAVRSYIENIDGFNSVTIYKAEKNKGLADSIMNGVTKIVNIYGKIIVLEDDIVTSKFFLNYMNDALNVYVNNNRVMHVSGYFYPNKEKFPDYFFYNQTSCWGWATWKRAWDKFSGDVDYLINSSKKLSVKNNGYFKIAFSQLKANKRGDIKTWAARWQMSVLLNNGLCLHSKSSFTQNIGNDGSGEHCSDTNVYEVDLINEYKEVKMSNLKEDKEVLNFCNNFIKKLKPNLLLRIYWRIIRMLKNKNYEK